ncbi:glycosyltransferase family 4 protein [Micromonospora sp. STR1s_5]|nr:glycosyltransferase family 4 protein [Micromonospora sp. STR1s_5]
MYLLLADGVEADRASFTDGVAVLLDDLRLPQAGWYAAKYDATQFCNALKPAFLQALSAVARKAVYLDCDIVVFSPFWELMEALDEGQIVLTPHLLKPFPRPEQYWVHPNNADIFHSGLMNGGCFAVDLQLSTEFLALWSEMNLSPGAFYNAVGGQTDQQYLNWSLVAAEDVVVLKDTAYNVAYWNLHERSLRADALDHRGSSWSVDGRPLRCFHFSGYSPADPYRLSKHDSRYSMYNLPSVALLVEWYRSELGKLNVFEASTKIYRFDVLGNGLPMNPLLREIAKKWEAYIPHVDVRLSEGADDFCRFLMSPLPATGSLLPLVLAEVYDRRLDLQEAYPGAHTDPGVLTFWSMRHGGREHEIDFLIERFRQTLVSDSLVGYTEDVAQTLGEIGQKLNFLGRDRRRTAEILSSIGRDDLSTSLLEGHNEWGISTHLGAVIALYLRRDDLQRSFRTIFTADHDRFSEWLARHALDEHGLPVESSHLFKAKHASIVLARVFSFLSRRLDLGEIAVRELLSDRADRLFRELIRGAGEGLEYDLADVEVLFFLHRHERHMLVPLYLELPPIRKLAFSARVPENRVLALPAEVRSAAWARFGCDLHAQYTNGVHAYLEDEVKKNHHAANARHATVLEQLRFSKTTRSGPQALSLAKRNALSRVQQRGGEFDPSMLTRERRGSRGVNLFGFFHADTGVGESSRGLASALNYIRPTTRCPLFTGHLRENIRLPELFTWFDYDADTNVIVSYPHQHESFFSMLPGEFLQGRRNIIHLAWEQRDWHPFWKDVYEAYDEIWAISEFAAGPFRELFASDKVKVVPNVVNFEDFPAALAHRPDDTAPFRFMFIFDANSSMERKNPEALLDSFIAAFSGAPEAAKVELYFKVGNLDRVEHGWRVDRLRRKAVASGLNIRFDGRRLHRNELLGLLSSASCYVSLHRAEGFGYTLAEAMYLGIPVIATGYSGNLEFMTERNSILVPYVESFIQEGDGPFQRGSVWADPDVEAAAVAMRTIYRDASVRQKLGEAGKASITSMLSARAVADRIRDGR